LLECVVNVSEGRDTSILRALAAACGRSLLDLHTDTHHHRSVFTLLGEAAPRALAASAVERLTLQDHDGVHPRIGVVDVVPFVALAGSTDADARAARDSFGTWAADTLGLPCFFYGPERTLPEVRRGAWHGLSPDRGPDRPHPTAGAVAVGARPVLVAYNLWLARPDLARAKAVAAAVRSPAVRALGLAVGDEVQVSCNLVAPADVGPADIYDQVALQVPVARAELVGLVPAAVLEHTPRARWAELDVAADRTIEARLAAAGV
jgi:glutamate formiminotransferase